MEISLHMYVAVANLTYNLRFTEENGQSVYLTASMHVAKLFILNSF